MNKLLRTNTDPSRKAQIELNRRKAVRSVKQVFGNWQLYLMVLPAVVYLLLFVYKPMYGIQIAFRDFRFKTGLVGSEWVGFKHFEALFNSYWFPVTLKNTLTISFLNLFLNFPLPILFALLVNELRNEKVKRTLQTVSYAPHFISTVVMAGMVIMLLSPTSGIINRLIELCGGSRISFMQKPEFFKWVYVFSTTWQCKHE